MKECFCKTGFHCYESHFTRNQNQNHELVMVDRVCALYIGGGWEAGDGENTLFVCSQFSLTPTGPRINHSDFINSWLNIMIHLFLISFHFLQIPLDVQCSPFLYLTQCSLAEIELQT